MSEYKRVQEFNKAAEQPCPDEPSPMLLEDVRFLTKMMLDELMEFMVTVTPNYKVEMIKMIGGARDLEFKELDEDELIAEQGDALVDCNYYALNSAAKHGIDLSKIFDVVHEANMAKRDPESRVFLRREDGKIIKPEGWEAPDIVEVVKSMKNMDLN